ncbi:MAG: hypothetical protein R3Y50_05240 [Rikenellaceae bacterium]
MIVEYDKSLFVRNVMEFTNRAIDLASVEGKVDFSKYYLTEHSINWIEKMLILSESEVRRYLNHLLCDDNEMERNDLNVNSDTSGDNDDVICEKIRFSLIPTHPIQTTLLPQLIEDAMVAYIAEKWCEENIISIIKGRSSAAFSELKSISLKCENNRGIAYRILN